MPIQEQNIVFLKSQVMDDVPEGGGAASGNVVADGVLNNVFEDVSDLDRIYGRFNLRKLYLGIRSLDTSLYGGAKVAITQLPVDPALGYTLFTMKSEFDTRVEAQDKVESYLYKSSMWHGAVADTLIPGMKQFNIIQRLGTALPPIGKTLCLVQGENAVGQKEQYVRITDVSSVKTTFTDDKGDFERLLVTCTIKDPFRHEFTGHSANRTDSYNYSTGVRLRNTVVANATNYYGSQTLRNAAGIGDVRVRAKSMFTSLVPSSATETPLVNQAMSPSLFTEEDAGGGVTVQVAQTAHTLARAVTEESRRFNWIETLTPKPKPGSLSIAFMSQGNWYEIKDDPATGKIEGEDDGIGSGTIVYSSGIAAITLGALPDADTQIIWTWASQAHYTIRTGTVTAKSAVQLPEGAIVRGSVTLGYLVGGVALTATDDGNGNLMRAGSQVATINYTNGLISLTVLVDMGSACNVTYSVGTPIVETFTDPPRDAQGGTVTLGIQTLPVQPNSVRLKWNTDVQVYNPRKRSPPRNIDPIMLAYDDGAGKLKLANGVEVGTIDYSTGVIHFLPDLEVTLPHGIYEWVDVGGGMQQYLFQGFEYVPAGAVAPVDFDAEVSYRSTDDPNAKTAALTATVDAHLNPGYSDELVAGSVRFSGLGKSYVDNGAGVLYTTDGTPAGTINYQKATVSIQFWGNSGSLTLNKTSCLIRYGWWMTAYASFRAQVAPIVPQGISFSVTAQDGALISVTADADGNFQGHDDVLGAINYEVGTAAIQFGRIGPDPDYEGTGTPPEVWIPRLVDPSTLRYNAVAYTYLPLDAEILGVDSVRLPADGRVPIFRPGDVVAISHTLDNAPATIADGGVLSAGRTRLGWVRVIDADGKTVNSEFYELDRPTGTVTFPTVTGLAQPLTLRHTVADLRLLTDTQINGWLAFSRPLTHNFPLEGTIVSSCLLFGDRRARVSAVWDQATWNNVWSDVPGAGTNATLNLIDFPAYTTNDGCDTDRFVLRCTNAAQHAWDLYSEKRGLIWKGTWAPEGEDLAPINKRTRTQVGPNTYIGGTPYFVIPGQANGGGWSTGNCIRINTIGAICNFWMARAIQQSEEPDDPTTVDGCEIYALGNIDRP